MTAKREKVHFESVEELLGAPVAKDATSEIRMCQYWFDRMMREPMR